MHASHPVISRRQQRSNPNHHLWNNHGTWWFHATFHHPNGTKQRHRASLQTRDLETARRRRDNLLRKLAATPAGSGDPS